MAAPWQWTYSSFEEVQKTVHSYGEGGVSVFIFVVDIGVISLGTLQCLGLKLGDCKIKLTG